MIIAEEIAAAAVEQIFDSIPALGGLRGWNLDLAKEDCRKIIALEIDRNLPASVIFDEC
jgi:hypothetical protein